MAVAAKIAGYSLPVAMMVKESINRAYETTLSEGVLFERRAVPLHVRARGPEGRHGRLRREAQAGLQEQVRRHSSCSGAHILSMLGFATYAALLPELRDEWAISQRAGGRGRQHVLRRLHRHRLVLDRAHRPGRRRAGSISRAACWPPRAASASAGGAAGFTSGDAFSRCCWARASPRPTCRGCACSRIASPGRRRAATSPSTPRSSASAPRFRLPSPARWRRSPAGAPPSSCRPPDRLLAGLMVFLLVEKTQGREETDPVHMEHLVPGGGVAQGARHPRRGRLHLRLCRALPGALRLARRGWWRSSPSRPGCSAGGAFPWQPAGDRRGGEPRRGAGIDRRQRDRAAHRAAGAGS